MRDLHWHLRPLTDADREPPEEIVRKLKAGEHVETIPFVEVIAFRHRCTGNGDFSDAELKLCGPEELRATYAALCEQNLRRGEWGRAFMDSLSRNGGDLTAAHAEMRRAWGRSISPSYAARLVPRWREREARRRREALQAFADLEARDGEISPRVATVLAEARRNGEIS